MAVFGWVAAMACGHAHAQVFDMSFDQFRATLDQRITVDTLDQSTPGLSTIKQCAGKSDVYTCTFNDRGFQRSVVELKKLGVVSGRITLRLTLTVDTARGTVTRIRLSGDRGDPANLFQFVGTSMNVMQTFEPHIVDGDGTTLALAKELGIMRGDDAAGISSPVVTSRPYATIRCSAAPSSITTAETCEWVLKSPGSGG